MAVGLGRPVFQIATLCFFACATTGAAQTDDTPSNERVWPVKSAPISFATHTIERDFSGNITSPSAMDLSFSRSGCITSVAQGLMSGTPVRADQPLFRLDDREVQIKHKIAMATAFEQQQTVAEQKAALQAAEGNYARKQAGLERARQYLERDNGLAERNLISTSIVEESQRRVWEQEEVKAAALDSLRKAQASSARIEATLARVNAELESSKLALDLHLVKAPFDGVIVELPTRAGACVTSGQRLATLADPKNREAQMFISLSVLERGDGTEPTVGSSARISKANGETCAGSVASFAGAVQEKSQSVAVTVALDPECADRFLINEAVRVRMKVREIENAVALPVSALREDNSVFLVDEDSRLAAVDVSFSFIFDGTAYVRFDPQGSDAIVLSPPPLAVEGMKVTQSRSE